MSTDQNKTIARRLIEGAWDKRDPRVLDQVYARDVCDHTPVPGQPRGLEGQRWFMDLVTRAVADETVKLDLLVAQGDFVADRWTTSGKQTGEIFGIPPTGKRFTISGSDLMRVSNGKIVEIWHLEDNLSMMQQLGVLPISLPQGTQGTGQRSTAGGTGASSRGNPLSDEEKRALIRRGFQEFTVKANPSAADTLLTPDFVGHFSGTPQINGREAFKQFISTYARAFSDQRTQVEDILIDGDYAACRATYTGKHTGDLFGLAPSGKEVSVKSINFFRFAGDQVAEQWSNNDDLGMMQQIGAVPVPQGMPVAEPC